MILLPKRSRQQATRPDTPADQPKDRSTDQLARHFRHQTHLG